MIAANELRPGTSYLEGSKLLQVITFQASKTARAGAVISCKVKDLRAGSIFSVSYGSSDKFKPAFIDKIKMNYIYNDGANFVFMNNSTYEQVEIANSKLEWESKFLIEGGDAEVITFNGEILGVQVPTTVSLTIAETEPAVKGNTVNAAQKRATLETGLEIQVPLFIEEGERVEVNTTNAEYKGRSK